ncbi:hypothetical protein SETIT_9G044200v2 [Setaria italica]|uniref:Uncharacterized protein n=1 Tax=Setaria italica TaxID=4555 RepID=A0A368SD28_SETIT|nr:hypothetical protein SETIT_9G044200v2 [Setaria italica]
MEDRPSDLKLGGSSRRGSGEASAAAAAADGTDTTSAWTGGKKPKIQSTPTSGSGDMGKVARDDDDDHSSAKIIVREQEQGPEQIEGIDWDQDKLDEKIDCYLQQLNRGLPDSDDDDFWVHCDDRQRREMNERLALCRIRAHEEEHRKLDDESLKAIYPANVLEDEEYYESYELDFEWYFDPQYCNYARLQDYQRLMLRNNAELWERTLGNISAQLCSGGSVVWESRNELQVIHS